MIIALVDAPGAAVKPYLVLTLWPRSAKPRPSASSIRIDLVKGFRACLLHESKDSADCFEPTEHVWLYTSQNVFAVLDTAASTDLNSGKIVLTHESSEALQRLNECQVGSSLKLHSKKKKKQGKQVRSKRVAAALKLSKEEKGSMKAVIQAIGKKNKKANGTSSMDVTAEDIRRSTLGRSNVKQVVSLIFDKELLAFQTDSYFDGDGYCRIPQAKDWTKKSLLKNAPTFFEHKYWQARKPEDCGGR